MALDNKYRVHEVAKDFGVSTREITEILTKYRTEPKNHMQVLDDADLSVIFEYMTQHHQVKNMESLLGAQQSERKEQPAAKQEEKPAEKASEQTSASSKVKQVHRIDTRGTGDVNLAKYDDHVDKLVDAKAERMESKGPKKQKLTKKSDQRSKPFGNKRRQEEQEKMRRLQRQQQMAALKKIPVKVMIPDEISVGELASRMKRTAADVIKGLIKLGVMASISEVIDYDTAAIVAEEMGCKVEKEVHVTIEEQLFDEHEDKAEELQPRDPVVVVMGHVDHGKTSLLDAIRSTGVADKEAGGITQHIGASVVNIDGRQITFIDTPGHEAFTAMRARGAKVTDVVVLVVAADDGVMPQTVEAINHANAANVPIVVAVNKIDKPGATPERVRQELTEHGIIPEEWGGQNMFVDVSARQNLHIDDLLETILLQADVLELKANPNASASGFVIEANLDKGRGSVATVLVDRGTLKTGDVVVAGTSYGKVRALINPRGVHVDEAHPADPVEILGLNSVPTAGDEFRVFEDERDARRLAEQRALRERLAKQESRSHMNLDDLFARIEEGKTTDLNLVVKADVAGSIEALRDAFEKMDQSEVKINIIHAAVGGITETDVTLAAASDAIIIGFNVRPTGKTREVATREKVDIRLYRVIYQAIEDINAARVGLLSPDIVEEDTGIAEVRETFKVPKVGVVAGCYIVEGEISRDDSVRIVRDGTVVYEGEIESLRRFKDDVKSVARGYECGIGIAGYQDIKIGDHIEGYRVVEVERTE